MFVLSTLLVSFFLVHFVIHPSSSCLGVLMVACACHCSVFSLAFPNLCCTFINFSVTLDKLFFILSLSFSPASRSFLMLSVNKLCVCCSVFNSDLVLSLSFSYLVFSFRSMVRLSSFM